MGTTITKATGDAVKKAALADIYTELREIKARQEDDSRYLGKRIDGLGGRLDTRMDALDQKINSRMDALDKKIDTQIGSVRQEIGLVNSRLDTIMQMLAEVLKQKSQ